MVRRRVPSQGTRRWPTPFPEPQRIRMNNLKGTNAMKSTALNVSVLALLPAALLLASALCLSAQDPEANETTAAAVQKGVPGGIVVNTKDISAKVTAIDKSKRLLTLEGPMGNELTVKVGPAAVNFNQIKVGDMVNATVTEQLVVALADPDAAPSDGTATVVALAAKGAPPGGVVANTTQVTGTVTAIDTKNRTATLKFEDGSTQTFPVRPDIDLSKHEVGTKVVFQVTQRVAIDVTKPE